MNFRTENGRVNLSLSRQKDALEGIIVTEGVRDSCAFVRLLNSLLVRLGAKEDDEEEKLGPTIRYLQKLGPEYLVLIFETSKWVFKVNPDVAFTVSSSWTITFRQLISL